jgi:hypothetical protein
MLPSVSALNPAVEWVRQIRSLPVSPRQKLHCHSSWDKSLELHCVRQSAAAYSPAFNAW